MSYTTGFTILAWVKPTSSIIQGLPQQELQDLSQALLQDFQILLSIRWNMEISLHQSPNGVWYAYGHNPRITIGKQTVANAIGELTEHIDFIRGSVHNSMEDLIRFKEAKEKWQVQENQSDTSVGTQEQEQAGTSWSHKRKR